jgi:hypothetical protein
VVVVVEPELFPVAADGGEGGQDGRVDAQAGVVAWHGHGVGLQGVDPAPEPGRQNLLQLRQRPQGRLLDPGDGAAGRGAQTDRDGDGFLVVEQQRRQGRAGAEPVSADGAARGQHRIAEAAQALHVRPHGSPAHPEALGEFRTRPVAGGLQEGEEPQQAGGGFQHCSRIPLY